MNDDTRRLSAAFNRRDRAWLLAIIGLLVAANGALWIRALEMVR